jgi:hypothetical protein
MTSTLVLATPNRSSNDGCNTGQANNGSANVLCIVLKRAELLTAAGQEQILHLFNVEAETKNMSMLICSDPRVSLKPLGLIPDIMNYEIICSVSFLQG